MSTGVGAIRFVALNGLTAVAAVALASRCELASRSERWLAAGVLFIGLALASGLSLGLAGWLQYGPLLLMQGALAAAAAAVARWPVAAALLGPYPLRRWLPGTAEHVAALVLGATYLYVVALGLVTEPFAGDELMYHLPIAVEYARQGRIVVPELGRFWNNDLWAYYPGGAYVLYQWALLPFGNGVVVDLVQLPWALGGGLAAYVLAQRCGASGRAAVWSALLFLAVPIVINQAKTALVDVTLAFLFAAGLAFLLAAPLTTTRLVLAAVAWGAVPGVKVSGVPFLVLGGLCVAASVLAHGDRRRAMRRLIRAGAALAAGAALLSGYWFVRNYLLTGSPVFPLNLVAGDDLAWSNIVFYGPLAPLLDFTVYEPLFLYNYETGAGAQFVALLMPASAVMAVWAVRQRRYGLAAAAVLALIAYPIWLFRFSKSLHTLFRYVLPVMPVGYAAVAWWIDRARYRSVLVGVALVCVIFSAVNAGPHVGSFLSPESIRSGLVALRRQAGRLGRFDRMGDLALQDYRRAWHYFDQLPGAHDIAARHLIFSYPMLGADFRHRVHFFQITSRDRWLADLRAAGVDRVAVAQFLGPNATVAAADGHLRLWLTDKLAGDEYVAATCAVASQRVEGIRLRYAVSSRVTARLRLALNDFAFVADLPVDSSGVEREHTIEWSGAITSVQVVLQPARRGRAETAVDVSAIALVDDAGRATAVPLRAGAWSRLGWPIEYYWMEGDTLRFEPVFTDHDAWDSPYSGEMRIYRFSDGGGP